MNRMLAVLAVLLAAAGLRAEEKVTLAAIAKAWKARQDKVKTGKFVWKEVRTDAKGFHSSSQPPSSDGQPPWGGKIVPPHDVTYETEVELAFRNSEMRYGYLSQFWSPFVNTMKVLPYLETFDGQRSKGLRAKGGLGTDWPKGMVAKGGEHADVRNPQVRPVLMTLRAMQPRLGAYNLDQFKLTGLSTVINGRSVLEMARRSRAAKGEVSVRLWVDSHRDFVILREVVMDAGVVKLQIDADYEPNSECGWIPNTWRIKTTHPDGSGNPFQNTEATLSSFDLNSEIQQSEFDIEFPLGTYVVDSEAGQFYIVTPQGKRVVTSSESGMSYEELMATTPASAPSLWTGWHTVGTLAILVSCSLLWLWRRLRVDGGVPPA